MTHVLDLLEARGADHATARSYVRQLIECQVLVPDIDVPVTGPEPIGSLVQRLDGPRPKTSPTNSRRSLTSFGRSTSAVWASPPIGIETSPGCSTSCRQSAQLSRLVQVDLVRAGLDVTLDRAVIDEIMVGIRVLHVLARPEPEDLMVQFCDDFSRRYGDRAVPLVEALDGEIGMPFGSSGDPAPLLEGLSFPDVSERTAPWGRRESIMLAKLLGAAADHPTRSCCPGAMSRR